MRTALAIAAFIVAAATVAQAAGHIPREEWTALDKYVRKADPAFQIHATGKTVEGKGYKGYWYNMTSQTWLTPQDTNHHVWWHDVLVIVPDNLNTSATDAFLWITWGQDKKTLKQDLFILDYTVTAEMAVNSGRIGVSLFQVPNQPICFAKTGQCGSEDEAIAIGWNFYMMDPAHNTEWLMYLPMTKAAVKCMDAVQETIAPRFDVTIKNFIVSGASKRGWTTWLTGAVDPVPGRVKAIIPLVLDALGFQNFIHRQFRSYAGYSFVLKPYWQNNVTMLVDSAIMRNVTDIMDPYSYRHRLTMPKLAINAVGDEFQLVDDQRHWAHDMPGEMKLLMVKNADHTLVSNFLEVMETASSFFQTETFGVARPTYSWSIDNTTGVITVLTSQPAKNVSLVYHNVKGPMRDFRDIVGKPTADKEGMACTLHVMGGCVRFMKWSTTNQVKVGGVAPNMVYTGVVPVPKQGYTGYFVQLTFPNPIPGGNDLIYSSASNVLPFGYPFPDCHGYACKGTLL